jgi:hypothetical protein
MPTPCHLPPFSSKHAGMARWDNMATLVRRPLDPWHLGTQRLRHRHRLHPLTEAPPHLHGHPQCPIMRQQQPPPPAQACPRLGRHRSPPALTLARSDPSSVPPAQSPPSLAPSPPPRVECGGDVDRRSGQRTFKVAEVCFLPIGNHFFLGAEEWR